MAPSNHHVGDLAVFRAIREAAKAFSETDLRRAAAGGPTQNLIALLRDGRSLSPVESEMLADMLAGDWSLPPNRRRKTARQRQDDNSLAADIRDWKSARLSDGSRVAASVAEDEAAEFYARDPRARNRSPATLKRLAMHDPYKGLLDDAAGWKQQWIAAGQSEPDAFQKAAWAAAQDHRARGRTPETIVRDLEKSSKP